MTEGNTAAMWVRLVVAASILWILAALGIIFAEYLFRDPLSEHYFWTSPGAVDPFFTRPEPRILQIAFVLFGPIAVFWVLGWLIAWVRHGRR